MAAAPAPRSPTAWRDVCPVCFNERDLDEDDLVENAELKGATPLLEFAGDTAMTFTY